MRPLSALDFWVKREDRILEILQEALKLLQAENALPKSENGLNRELNRCILKANFELVNKGRGLDRRPFYDAPNQPSVDDETRAARENKRPDFQWSLYDDLARDPRQAYLEYVVECKRLGSPSSPSWVLNKNYVTDGICRFRDPDHGYGEGVRSGAMVGYVQSMELSLVLKEVNRSCLDNKVLKLIELTQDGWQEGSVSRLEQQLQRPKVLPVAFCLRHLWLDIRSHYG